MTSKLEVLLMFELDALNSGGGFRTSDLFSKFEVEF
jgi:hypothetical protein